MVTSDILAKLGESFSTTANVKSVFGEPINTQGKTIVPVAKVAYGLGAGGGNGPAQTEGGGGGGGVRAFPAGVLEITETETRFIPFTDFRWVAGALLVGYVLGRLVSFGNRK